MAWRKKVIFRIITLKMNQFYFLQNITEDSTEDKYFDDEASAALNQNLLKNNAGENEEIDPLDAFMQSIEKEMKKESSAPVQKVCKVFLKICVRVKNIQMISYSIFIISCIFNRIKTLN